jgi:hypothetical protein
MQGPAWLSLLRRLPTALHDGLIIVTTNTAEIVVQSIVRAERDFLVIRGRMAGSQDTGRIVFVPFDQINYLGLTKKPSEAEVQAFLAKPVAGGPAEPAAGPAVAQAVSAEVEAFVPEVTTEPEPPPPEEPSPVPPRPGAAAAQAPKPNHPSKTVLLARLRARLGSDGAVKPSDAPPS